MTKTLDYSLNTRRKLMGVAGLAYLIWWGVVELALPGSFNPLGSRLAVVGFCWALVASSWGSAWVSRQIEIALSACVWLITLHFFYLFHHNPTDINWVVGSYITVIAASVCLQGEAASLAYSVWVVALSLLLCWYDRTLLRTIFLPGIVTILVFAFVGMRARIRLLERTLLYEASQRSIQVRDEFLSIASHELKTPLTNLKLQTQIAMRGIKRGDPGVLEPQRVRTYVEQMERQADRLIRLVEEMLDLSRIVSGKFAIKPEPFDLADTVREITASFEGLSRQGGGPLQIEAPAALLYVGDRIRIEQVISNLLSNAFEYGDGKPILVQVGEEGGQARLIIEDQGVGIPIENQQRVFERFERTASPRRTGGLGLGLYITRQIVEAHGGRIELWSQPERGSRFTVVLPNGRLPT